MPTVAEVMRRHGAAYLERFGAAMPAEHKKVLRTIMACRTGQRISISLNSQYFGEELVAETTPNHLAS